MCQYNNNLFAIIVVFVIIVLYINYNV